MDNINVILNSEFSEILRIEGVNFKGFGIIPKFVMLDPDLSIEAKTIYSYFCSFAGNGTASFPGRDKILSDLPMSKDAYYSHFRQLIENGYISVEQTKKEYAAFGNNVYTLISNPKKFEEQAEDKKQNLAYSRIKFSGLKSAGYGMIPKAVMIDPRLPVKAKGIYSYFCSFTGSGNNAFPKKDKILYHLGITEKTYYKFYKLLTDLNYITAVQRHIGGRLQVNDYYLNDTPDIAQPSQKIVLPLYIQDSKKQDTGEKELSFQDGKKQDTEKKELSFQDGKKQDTIKQDTIKQDTTKQDTNINSSNINNSNINQSFNQKPASPEIPASKEDVEGMNEEYFQIKILDEIRSAGTMPFYFTNDEKKLSEAIKIMSDWETFQHSDSWGSDRLSHSSYVLFVEALTEMLTASTYSMQLKGANVNYSKVYEKFSRYILIDSTEISIWSLIESATNDFKNACATTKIKNHLQYMKACIWNTMQTADIALYASLRKEGF